MADASKPGPRTTTNPGTTPGAPPGRTPTNPGMPAVGSGAKPGLPGTPSRVMSAARPKTSGSVVDRAKAGAEDVALNTAAVLKEKWQEFQASNRFFKYKVMIVGAWLFLSSGTLVAACPGSQLAGKNSLEARLVIAGDTSRPVYMIVNEGTKSWKDVLVIVNHEYRSAVEQVEPHGTITLTTKQMLGANGSTPPPDLRVQDMEIRTDSGKTMLLKRGEVQ